MKDALDSLSACDQTLFETIIVNDGSTDEYTNNYTQQLQQEGYNVIFQENKGLAEARNTGIRLAKGEYILPLDADNKVLPEYMTISIDVLRKNPEIAVVYGDANYFGERKGIWKMGEFNLQRLMLYNYIDACAMVRKKIFIELGFYDANMVKQGMEDWDLWLRVGFAGYRFHYINKPVFEYRVVGDSMIKNFATDYKNPNSVENYIHAKYPEKMGHEWIIKLYVSRFKKNPFLFIAKLMIRTYFPSYYNSLLKKNKIRNGL
ncbi:MAG: glycosyltransferase family 2 protein [Bacteroidetes bacterium]|nr:glycosyltransferase family 2 protein [Bacteroidota bacterium]